MAKGLTQRSARGRVPEPGFAALGAGLRSAVLITVMPGRQDDLAVWADGHRADEVTMRDGLALGFAGRHVPPLLDPLPPAGPGCPEAPAVGAELHVIQRHIFQQIRAQRLARGGVPEVGLALDGGAGAAKAPAHDGYDGLAVGAERCGLDIDRGWVAENRLQVTDVALVRLEVGADGRLEVLGV